MQLFPLKILSFFSGIFLLLILSCTPGSCFEETEALVKASMYESSTGKLAAPDSVTLFGIDKAADKIYNKNPGVKQALLPLDPVHENCSFIIRINGITDTLTFTYTSYPHFISKECGYTYYFTIDQPLATDNIIDRIIITKRTITHKSEENLRIYY